MPCLICRYFQPTEPLQHQQDREAGRCESNCGKDWNRHTAIHYIQNHGGKIEGWCRLNPETKHVATHAHVCSQISVYDYFYNHHWCVEPIKPNEGLFEWASETLGTVLRGGDSWSRRRLHELEEQHVELKRQLKQARRISSSRFKRLQEIENRREPIEPAAEPVFPHLVAAE